MRKEIDLYSNELVQAITDLPYSDKIDSNGTSVFIPESDYGFAEIYRMYDDILVFLIPTYGGTPSLYRMVHRHSISQLVSELRQIN